MKSKNAEMRKFYIKDFAYWVGVVQTDGFFKVQNNKRSNRKIYAICLRVCEKSFPMQKKFIEISQKIFKIKGSTFFSKNYCNNPMCEYKFGCKDFLEVFKKLKIDFKKVNPPKWISSKPSLFGAYLAGVIDGDGDVRISRPKYPQYVVRISSGNKLNEFVRVIKKKLNCGVYEVKRTMPKRIAHYSFIGTTYYTEFKVSSKNVNFFRKFVVDKMAIPYKRERIREYIMKRVTCGI